MKIIAILFIAFLLAGLTDARMLQKGDDVSISVAYGQSILTYNGIVTDLNNGLVSINATAATLDGDVILREPKDVAIGVGAITTLTWFN